MGSKCVLAHKRVDVRRVEGDVDVAGGWREEGYRAGAELRGK